MVAGLALIQDRTRFERGGAALDVGIDKFTQRGCTKQRKCMRVPGSGGSPNSCVRYKPLRRTTCGATTW